MTTAPRLFRVETSEGEGRWRVRCFRSEPGEAARTAAALRATEDVGTTVTIYDLSDQSAVDELCDWLNHWNAR